MNNDSTDRLYADIGRRVRAARRDVTQQQLARRLGMTRSSIANLEAGRQRIPIHVLLGIADALDVNVTTLLPEETSDPVTVDLPDELPDSSRRFVLGCLASLGASD